MKIKLIFPVLLLVASSAWAGVQMAPTSAFENSISTCEMRVQELESWLENVENGYVTTMSADGVKRLEQRLDYWSNRCGALEEASDSYEEAQEELKQSTDENEDTSDDVDGQ